MLEYGDRLKIYQHRECVAEYRLPADGVRNTRVQSGGMPRPARQPKNRKQPTQEEEKRLRAMSASRGQLPELRSPQPACSGTGSCGSYSPFVPDDDRRCFIQTIERALRYRIADIETLQRIARLSIDAAGRCRTSRTSMSMRASASARPTSKAV